MPRIMSNVPLLTSMMWPVLVASNWNHTSLALGLVQPLQLAAGMDSVAARELAEVGTQVSAGTSTVALAQSSLSGASGAVSTQMVYVPAKVGRVSRRRM